GARSFLLRAQEKRTKEKAPLHARPSGSLPGCGGSPTGHPWPDDELADVLSATLAGLILHPSAAPEGDPAARCAARFANQQNSCNVARTRVLADMSRFIA